MSPIETGNIEDQLTCTKVIGILKAFTGNLKCFFYYYFLKRKIRMGDAVLFCDNLDDLPSLYKNPIINGSPTYWWAEDKSWCVCTDYDLDFTQIGGSRKLINQFLQDDFLECIEGDLNTRIDYKADENNKPL